MLEMFFFYVRNCLVNHLYTQFTTETINQDLNRHIFRVLGRHNSLILVYNSTGFYSLCIVYKK